MASIANTFKIILGSKSIARRKIMEEMGYKFTILTADIDEKAIRKEKPEDLVMALAEAKADAIISKLQIADKQVNDHEPTLLLSADTAEATKSELIIGDHSTDAAPSILITGDQRRALQVNPIPYIHFQNRIFLFKSYQSEVKLQLSEVVVYEGMVREKPSSEEEARQFMKDYSGKKASTVSSVLVTNLQTGFRKGEWDKVEILFDVIPEEVIDNLIKEGDVLHVAGGLIIEHPLILPLVKEVVGTTDSVMGLPKAVTKRLIEESL